MLWHWPLSTLPFKSEDSNLSKLDGSSPYQNNHNSLLHDKWSVTRWSVLCWTRLHTHRMSDWIHLEYETNTGSSKWSTEAQQSGSAINFLHFIPHISVWKKNKNKVTSWHNIFSQWHNIYIRYGREKHRVDNYVTEKKSIFLEQSLQQVI